VKAHKSPKKSPQKWTGVMWAISWSGGEKYNGIFENGVRRLAPLGYYRSKQEALNAEGNGTDQIARRVTVTITPLARKAKARATKKED
jgi:hypothetical protein